MSNIFFFGERFDCGLFLSSERKQLKFFHRSSFNPEKKHLLEFIHVNWDYEENKANTSELFLYVSFDNHMQHFSPVYFIVHRLKTSSVRNKCVRNAHAIYHYLFFITYIYLFWSPNEGRFVNFEIRPNHGDILSNFIWGKLILPGSRDSDDFINIPSRFYKTSKNHKLMEIKPQNYEISSSTLSLFVFNKFVIVIASKSSWWWLHVRGNISSIRQFWTSTLENATTAGSEQVFWVLQLWFVVNIQLCDIVT